MIAMIRSEWIKLRRSVVWVVVALPAILTFAAGWLGGLEEGGGSWQQLLAIVSVMHGLLFLPLLVTILTAFVCRYEHQSGGWKQLLALPVSRYVVYTAKLTMVALLLALLQLLILAALLFIGTWQGYAEAIPWGALLASMLGGWAACLPLAALQMFAATWLQSFAAPVAIGTFFTLPNILIINSEDFAPYYPWAQPTLAMMPREQSMSFDAFGIASGTLPIVILVSFVAFYLVGWIYFTRKAV
ncbi:hypothetical protein PA598K_05771 [Paenibacillus sp. 598K]|uniref:ABC transporter permease n=1 Tax=Paenibacillus sp. 598K TaxID=1117987 RepID=UPI000FFAC5A8|nr:ABC transporter permease [Paenibacillus sp. 598K]GBF77235.1 hypothetical protein PA598K_05771 [Paenibacillus sp. 598K]